ncbi:MAG TPA: hypothetical protein VGC62_12315 [Pseudomonas sp.]
MAIVLSHPHVAGAYAKKKKHIDRFCGALIIFLGFKQQSFFDEPRT